MIRNSDIRHMRSLPDFRMLKQVKFRRLPLEELDKTSRRQTARGLLHQRKGKLKLFLYPPGIEMLCGVVSVTPQVGQQAKLVVTQGTRHNTTSLIKAIGAQR